MKDNRITAQEIKKDYETYGCDFLFIVEEEGALSMESSHDEFDSRYLNYSNCITRATVDPEDFEGVTFEINNVLSDLGY